MKLDQARFDEMTHKSDALVERIRPILAGHIDDPEVVGATLAHLLAIFVAAHNPELRENSLTMVIDCAKSLVPVIVDELIDEGRAPDDWREATKK